MDAPIAVNLETEQAIVGGICVCPDKTIPLLGVARKAGLHSKHFGHETYSRLFTAICQMAEEGIPINAFSLADRAANEQTTRCEILAWVSDCTSIAMTHPAHMVYLVEKTVKRWKLRTLGKIGQALVSAAYADNSEPATIAAKAIERIQRIVGEP